MSPTTQYYATGFDVELIHKSIRVPVYLRHRVVFQSIPSVHSFAMPVDMQSVVVGCFFLGGGVTDDAS